jgi:hypothetical protein
MVVVGLALVTGARAEQMMLDADATYRAIFSAAGEAEQRTLYQQAIAGYHAAVALAPTNAAYLRRAGARQLPPAERRDYLTRARTLEPTNSANWVAWGDFLLDAKQPTEAINAYRAALTWQPRQLDVHYRLALAFWGLRNATATQEHLRAILDTIGTPLDVVRPISVPEPFYTQAWYATGVLAEREPKLLARARAAYAQTLAYARKYEEGFTLEAEAMAMMTNNDLERERMRQLAATAYVRLRGLDSAQPTEPYIDPKLALPQTAWGNPFP